ncbi:MAG: hypothetical protein KME17_01475 [Cyanosarcina radialis HA8281-LM2]|jgi:hypothetical protein|nr:hypothetical protein [Cyanosarcina radialis HA8281-LM2]
MTIPAIELPMDKIAEFGMNYIAERSREELATDLQFEDATIRRLSLVYQF